MKRYIATALLVLPVVLAPLTGCGSGDTSAPGTGARRFGSLEFTLTTSKASYAVGEPVASTFTIKNVGTKTVTAGFTGCGIANRIYQGIQVIAGGGGCPADNFAIDYAPGETRTIKSFWDQKDASGIQVQPGQYTLKAWLPSVLINGTSLTAAQDEQDLSADPVQFTIGP